MLQPAPLNRTIPITAFNRGKAGQIFSDVKRSGMTVVIKNNEAECVLLAPDEYRVLLERLEDAELLSLANARMQNFKMEDTCSSRNTFLSSVLFVVNILYSESL